MANLALRQLRAVTALLVMITATPAATADGHALAGAALQRTQANVTYDGAYRTIGYPNGDVPAHIGVCTDVLIRAYRSLGVDLQVLVHEDMVQRFDAYPQLWGLAGPDPNIDHRRVPNLEAFFRHHGETLPLSDDASDYLPGDIVSWRLPGGLPHIGIVGARRVPGTERHFVIHNIGSGPKEEDVLFAYQLNGHFRYPAAD